MKDKFLIFPDRKKGWIRVIEAFFAIVLIMGALLVVVDKGTTREEYSEEVYMQIKTILQEIEINENLRENISDVTPLPVNWEDFEVNGLIDVKNKIIERTPNYLNCSAKVCEIGDECVLGSLFTSTVYTSSINIYATNSKYAPRQLKLFCWERGSSISSDGGEGESCTPDCSGSIDSWTKLLLHVNTNFTDSSSSGHTVTPNGDAQISSSQSQIGAGSVYFDGNGDYLSIPDSADWDFGSGDFTIDFWMRFNDVSTHRNLMDIGDYYNNKGVALFYNHDNARLYVDTNGATGPVYNFPWSPSINTWYHVALIRSGTNLKVFINGTQAGSTETDNQDIDGGTSGATIGKYTNGNYPFYGYIDELRISKGIARWTENFTPPTREYPLDKNCGDDGCEGSCGSCGGGESCVSGSCVAEAPQTTWANWDESSEEGLASEDIFVALMENASAGGNELGQGGGLTGENLVLTQVGDVAGATGSPPKRAIDATDDRFTWTAAGIQNFLGGTTFTFIWKYDTFADNTATYPAILANGAQYMYIYVNPSSKLAIYYKDTDTTSDGAVETTNSVPTTGNVYFYIWSDGTDINWGFSTTKKSNPDDIAAGDKAKITATPNFNVASVTSSNPISYSSSKSAFNAYYFIASKESLIEND